jgi:hypothetical protein
MQNRCLALALCLVGFLSLKAQTPYNWTFSARKISNGIYEIHCIADVSAPWHTYSQFTPAGGPVPTKFSFAKNPLYRLNGSVTENGKMVTKHEAVFGVDVKYFEGKVDFVQKVNLKGNAKTNFTGSVEFMVCNDTECLPPASLKFAVALD